MKTLPPELFNSVLFQNKNFGVKVYFIAEKTSIYNSQKATCLDHDNKKLNVNNS